MWEQYSTQIILAACAVFLVQTALIGWLIYEHRRRHFAEVQARNAMSELTQLNRFATAGELSAAIAHEVKQPITGIVTMANAASRWLSRENPDIGRARDALDKVVLAGHRAMTSSQMSARCSGRTRRKNNRPISTSCSGPF